MGNEGRTHNEDLNNFCCSPKTVRLIKSEMFEMGMKCSQNGSYYIALIVLKNIKLSTRIFFYSTNNTFR